MRENLVARKYLHLQYYKLKNERIVVRTNRHHTSHTGQHFENSNNNDKVFKPSTLSTQHCKCLILLVWTNQNSIS